VFHVKQRPAEPGGPAEVSRGPSGGEVWSGAVRGGSSWCPQRGAPRARCPQRGAPRARCAQRGAPRRGAPGAVAPGAVPPARCPQRGAPSAVPPGAVPPGAVRKGELARSVPFRPVVSGEEHGRWEDMDAEAPLRGSAPPTSQRFVQIGVARGANGGRLEDRRTSLRRGSGRGDGSGRR